MLDAHARSVWLCLREHRRGDHWVNRAASRWTSPAWSERLAPAPYGRVCHIELCFELDDGRWERASIFKFGTVHLKPCEPPNQWPDYYAVLVHCPHPERARAWCEAQRRSAAGFHYAGYILNFLLWPFCCLGWRRTGERFFCSEVVLGALRAGGSLPAGLDAIDGKNSPNRVAEATVAARADAAAQS